MMKQPRPSVMLVDDDEVFADRLRTFMERCCGVSVIARAHSGEEALARVAEILPRVITLDISMGGISGLEALPKLLEASPHSVVIVVSSMPEAYGQEAVTLGASGYVHKSRIFEELPNVVDRILADA